LVRELEDEDRVDEPLLSAVVDVALQATARFVGGRQHASARRRERRPALGVRDRDGDEIGELRQAFFGAGRQDVGGRRGRQDAPDPSGDDDRRRDR
jgi:hypothetical protein